MGYATDTRLTKLWATQSQNQAKFLGVRQIFLILRAEPHKHWLKGAGQVAKILEETEYM